ncbi:hypothetical protein [Nocardia sp. NPDC048505]|uniref:hypothetical protein n=1 Tax=unclassified Nocardia TaxID=2637762 RepID=UPI0033E4C00D
MCLSISRRGLLGHAGAVMGLGILTAAGRSEAQPATPEAPKPGQTTALAVTAAGGTLVVNLPPPLPPLRFTGTRVVRVLDGGTDFVSLRVTDFHAEAAHPLFGKVTLRQPEVDPGPQSVLALSPSRLGLIETWHQHLRVTFERCGDCPGPFRFQTLEPAEWTAELQQFPPSALSTGRDGKSAGGAHYRMTRPIRLGRLSPAAVAHASCDQCALQSPLPSGASEYARIENLDFAQGRVPN